MRDSEVGSLNHTDIIANGDSKGQNHKNNNNNNSFVIREVPIQRTNRGSNNASSEPAELSKGKSFSDVNNLTMDYDTPELVVFLQEDREVSTRGKCVIEDCEVESNSESCEETTEKVSSVSDGSGRKCGFRNLMMMMEEGDHPTENATSETLKEILEEEEDFPRLFNNFHNIDSFLRTISSRMEFPHCADCQQFPETGNSRSTGLDGEGNHGESSSARTTTTRTKSGCFSHRSSDSISSAQSFTFPVLPSEWIGSPVRMVEAERTSQSRRHRWCRICCPCCKF